LKFLIYGRTGWIGGLLGKICQKQGILYEYGSGRLENRAQLEADIASAKPSHVFNAAGVTGRPNVDWCESHKVETIRANVVGTLTLADVCKQSNLLLINFELGAFVSMTKITSLVVELVSRKTTHQILLVHTIPRQRPW
jgi:dTDP-4-dehydrorhamnose reductase